MRLWPWSRREARQSSGGSYTDLLGALIRARAEGAPVDAETTSAVEACAGLLARSLAVADVSPATVTTAALTPSVLACCGRELIRRGESVFLLDVAGGRVRALPASDWDVLGGPRPESWYYRVSLPGPSAIEHMHVPAAGVLHFRFSSDPREPWRGIGPLAWASTTARALAGVEGALAGEVTGPYGHLVPLPQDANPELLTDVGSLRGGVKTVESTRAYAESREAVPEGDWRQRRVGADPQQGMISLRSDAARAVFHACGVPESLFEKADGTSAREAWRRYLHSTIAPIGLTLAGEAAVKLDAPDLALGFDRLFASDLASRARSLASMIQAGLPLDQAAALAGLSAES